MTIILRVDFKATDTVFQDFNSLVFWSLTYWSTDNNIPVMYVFVPQPDACRTNFDAVSMIRGELFFFKSRYVWRIRDGQLQPGYPALASRHWRGIPDRIDAAYEDKSGNIWFFQG